MYLNNKKTHIKVKLLNKTFTNPSNDNNTTKFLLFTKFDNNCTKILTLYNIYELKDISNSLRINNSY